MSSTNGVARDPHGRFAVGTVGGPGNPYSRQVNEFRAALFSALTVEEFHAIARKLIALAIEGQPWAVKELFDRILGKPIVGVTVAEVDAQQGRQLDYSVLTDEEVKQMDDIYRKLDWAELQKRYNCPS
jgi:hypothetical protein